MLMKSLLSRVGRWAAAFLGLITVSACYGVPYADFEVKGHVTDENDKPIEGIEVSGHWGAHGQATTANDGSFSVSGEYNGGESMELVFTDVDGEENGGKFKRKIVDVELTQVKKGGQGFYGGKYIGNNVNVKLKLDDGSEDAGSEDGGRDGEENL